MVPSMPSKISSFFYDQEKKRLFFSRPEKTGALPGAKQTEKLEALLYHMVSEACFVAI